MSTNNTETTAEQRVKDKGKTMVRRTAKHLLAATCGLAIWSGATARAQTLEWTQSLEIGEATLGRGVSTDQLGSVYFAGTFYHNADPNARNWDAFVSKYNAAGNQVWVRQLGSSDQQDGSFEVSADTLGNVFIATEGGARLAKYDSSGNLAWVRQVPEISTIARSVSADGLGNAYICGTGFQDANLAKYDATGNLLWARRFGTTKADGAYSVSADSLGNAYVAGYTWGDLGGPNAGEADAFLTKYDPAGNQMWLRQFGTAATDGITAVSADALGNVFSVGFTYGSLDGPNAGGGDLFVRKYDGSGSLLWNRQLGSTLDDGCCTHGTIGSETPSAAADGMGNIYLTGFTEGDLGGVTAAGNLNPFVAKYDAAGNLRWVKQFGTDGAGTGVSTDGFGNVYVSNTNTNLQFADIVKIRDDAPVTPSGDFNTDGTVDAADYVVWRNGLGSKYTQADYDLWRVNFGQTGSSGPLQAGVAEPSTLALVSLLGLLTLIVSRRSQMVFHTCHRLDR
jgi:hypothetical protein